MLNAFRIKKNTTFAVYKFITNCNSMLLVIYNIDDENVTNELLVKANEFGETNQILPNSFLLDTSLETGDVFNDLKAIMANKGRIMIAKIHRNEINGWLSTASVEWINSKSFN